MKETLLRIGVDALYLLALINPISKVSVLSAIDSDQESTGIRSVAWKSSGVAVAILLGAMICGNYLLSNVFHVELYSLRLAGGAVLCWVGFNALRKGVFFEQGTQDRFQDLALVPLACPMIAGPATIAACIALSAREAGAEGHLPVLPALAMIVAVSLNYIIMRLARPISLGLSRFNILGALIRITGLIVMTIGTQMVLDGISDWRSISQ